MVDNSQQKKKSNQMLVLILKQRSLPQLTEKIKYDNSIRYVMNLDCTWFSFCCSCNCQCDLMSPLKLLQEIVLYEKCNCICPSVILPMIPVYFYPCFNWFHPLGFWQRLLTGSRGKAKTIGLRLFLLCFFRAIQIRFRVGWMIVSVYQPDNGKVP